MARETCREWDVEASERGARGGAAHGARGLSKGVPRSNGADCRRASGASGGGAAAASAAAAVEKDLERATAAAAAAAAVPGVGEGEKEREGERRAGGGGKALPGLAAAVGEVEAAAMLAVELAGGERAKEAEAEAVGPAAAAVGMVRSGSLTLHDSPRCGETRGGGGAVAGTGSVPLPARRI